MPLSPADRHALQVYVNLKEFSPEEPTPKQRVLIDDDREELFYGGKAGGGKSSGLLMAYLKYVHVPGYAGIILRKTYADLTKPGAIMDRALEWFRPRGVHWNSSDHIFTFPSGARLAFGHLDSANAHTNYQGGEYQFIGVDEVPHIPEHQYRYLFSRLRRLESMAVPRRMRSTGNPGGLEWVKRRFVDEYTREPGARFVEAGTTDNPHLSDDYRSSLAKLDPVTRAQLQDGNWDISAQGNTFKREWWGFVDALPDGCGAGIRRWDMASTEPRKGYADPDYTASCRGVVHNGITYIVHATKDRRGPGETIAMMKAQAVLDGPIVKVRTEREPGSASVREADNLARTTFAGYDFEAIASTGDKVLRARPLSAAAEQGTVKLLRGEWNQWWIDDMALFPTPGVHDDTTDAASGLYYDLHGSTLTATQLKTGHATRVTHGLSRGRVRVVGM